MTIAYSLTDRKPFVKALEQITGAKAVYKGIATCSYEIGTFTVTREGNLNFNDSIDRSEVEMVLKQLEVQGFHAENGIAECPSEAYCGSRSETNDNSINLTISLPRSSFTASQLDNLQRIIDSKSSLLKAALGVQELPILVTEDTVSFPWFPRVSDANTCTAYTDLISAICKMARNAKRVTATEKEVANEKYAFRCFLLRLGFIGEEFKADRKILLKNLSGSAAFKSGKKKDAADVAPKGGEQE